jgi:aryl-alcohol dehydrogenase-like predicted oxidoreductase
MEYRSLGRTGVKVSVQCLGCMMFGGKTPEDESLDIIDRAIDGGINFLDTANVYSRGRSEEVVGNALKRNGKRSRIVLATKVHGRMDDDDINAQGNTRRHIVEQCEASLRRLQTDYIDLYQIHRPSSSTPIDETLRALDDLIRAGKVHYVGTSTYASWQFMEALWVAKELGLHRFVSEQPPYHILDRRIEREMIPMAQTYGVAILPWSPLAGGFLTGKYKRGESRASGTRFEEVSEWADRHFTDRAFDVLEVIEKIAEEKNCTISQLALAWCAQQPGVTSPIIGPRTMDQLMDNLGALDVKLTDGDMTRIDEVAAPGTDVVPYYSADFARSEYR